MRAHVSKRLIFASFALTIALAGCASSGGGGGSSRSSPSRLTMEDFTPDMQSLNLLTVIQRLRPAWLRARGNSVAVVYVDGNRRGGTNELNTIRIDEVQRVERMSGPDATMRFGTNNDGGAILVTLRR
jgi:hypothetical protein